MPQTRHRNTSFPDERRSAELFFAEKNHSALQARKSLLFWKESFMLVRGRGIGIGAGHIDILGDWGVREDSPQRARPAEPQPKCGTAILAVTDSRAGSPCHENRRGLRRNWLIAVQSPRRKTPVGADTRCLVSAISRRDLFFRPRYVASILSCAMPFYHRNWTTCITTL